MQRPPLCHLISSSQWRSLSLYLSLRHLYTGKAGSYVTDKTNSTVGRTPKHDDDDVDVASVANPTYPEGSHTNAVIIRTYDASAKAHTTNDNGRHRAVRRTKKYDYEALKGVGGDDNDKRRGKRDDRRLAVRSTLDRKSMRAADAMAVKRLARKEMGDGRGKERGGREELDIYRPLRRRSGAGDIHSQVKAELNSSRGEGSQRPFGSSLRGKSRSLLDEVFPSDDSRARAGSTGDNELEEMPRLKLEHLMKDEEYKAPTKAQSEEEKLRLFYEAERENLGKEKGMLLLRGLGPSLEEEDFRRLSPTGKHIEGWEHELGTILKVIPGRDLDTMEKTGAYYLVFASPESAMIYKEEVERRHALSKMYRPHDISSPIPPPPGYLVNGEDVHALIEGFTLVPPRQKLLIMPIHEPFDDLVQSLVDHGGYKAIRQGQQKQDQLIPEEPRTKVLVSTDGPVLPFMSILDGINLDGKSRGWHWNTIEKNPVAKLDFTGWRGVVPGQYETPGNHAELLRRRNRCTVEFSTESEAKRFARAWHCTRLPRKSSIHDNGTEGPLVSAEVVW